MQSIYWTNSRLKAFPIYYLFSFIRGFINSNDKLKPMTTTQTWEVNWKSSQSMTRWHARLRALAITFSSYKFGFPRNPKLVISDAQSKSISAANWFSSKMLKAFVWHFHQQSKLQQWTNKCQPIHFRFTTQETSEWSLFDFTSRCSCFEANNCRRMGFWTLIRV